jgi:hypothetical protein
VRSTVRSRWRADLARVRGRVGHRGLLLSPYGAFRALIEISGVSDEVLLAAALLWRVFYSIIPLPAGAITLSRFRKANPDALRYGATAAT